MNIFKRIKRARRTTSAPKMRALRERRRAAGVTQISVELPSRLAAQLREYAKLRGATLSATTAELLASALGPRE
jgi:hypothetical protein